MRESDGSSSIWTPSQRGVLIAFVLGLCVFLSIRLWINSEHVSNPPPAHAAKYGELADRLDPNTASEQELSVLPQLGEKRAKEIASYREQYRAEGRGTTPFQKAEDLLVIKGIGVSLLTTIKPYLTFPAVPATIPAL